MALGVIDALRRFLPDYLNSRPPLSSDQRRAIWAIEHCRTPTMGGHLYACKPCGERAFAWHSCNHKACPQCGREATRKWVERELGKRVNAPYFMVTFTLTFTFWFPSRFCKEPSGIIFGADSKPKSGKSIR
jgi:predicted RNA-binding Zn-ribbon protein involved in translation (DUF1610 family)